MVSPKSNFRLKNAERPDFAGTSCALKEKTFERRFMPRAHGLTVPLLPVHAGFCVTTHEKTAESRSERFKCPLHPFASQ